MSIKRTKMNYERIKDKIHACWIGKNIGGTIGGPYEGKQELLNVTGFSSTKGGARAYSDNLSRLCDRYVDFEFTVTEQASAFNRVIVEALISDRHMPILFEIPISVK